MPTAFQLVGRGRSHYARARSVLLWSVNSRPSLRGQGSLADALVQTCLVVPSRAFRGALHQVSLGGPAVASGRGLGALECSLADLEAGLIASYLSTYPLPLVSKHQPREQRLSPWQRCNNVGWLNAGRAGWVGGRMTENSGELQQAGCV